MCMTPHGPDTATFEGAVSKDSSVPEHLPDNTLAFMFEVRPRAFLGSPGTPAMRTRCYHSSVLCVAESLVVEVEGGA